MQEIRTKIDQAIGQHHDWLKNQLIDAVTLSKNYADPSEWLTANRVAVEEKLGLSRTETCGSNWQHLQAQVRAVLTGTFARPAVSEIKWGDEPKTSKIEFGDEHESFTLSEKIALLKTLLARHSSEGKACVPTCYAYMQILGEKISNPAVQQQKLDQILTRWRREFNGDWIYTHQLTEKSSRKEIISELSDGMQPYTGLNNLDALLGFWELNEDRSFFPRDSEKPGVSFGERAERSSIISTVAPLTGIVVSVEPTNPFWQQDEWLGKTPKVGDMFTTARMHAMLVVDCTLSRDGDQKKAKFSLIDPQTGTVIQITAQEIYNTNWNNFERRYLTAAELAKNKYKFQKEFSCGTCWVGKTD